MTNKQEILDYARQKYGTVPDYPWLKYPQYAVLRHKKSRKWYGLILEVTGEKLGLAEKEKLEILNLKSDTGLVSMLGHPAVKTAYHMNKKHWVSVILKDISHTEVAALLDLSYDLTK